MDDTIALDGAASAPGSLALELAAARSFLVGLTGDTGVGSGVLVGVADDNAFLRERRMVERWNPRCSNEWHGHV